MYVLIVLSACYAKCIPITHACGGAVGAEDGSDSSTAMFRTFKDAMRL